MMSTNRNIKILQWNIRSFHQNKGSLENLLNEKNIDIIVLCTSIPILIKI